MDEKLADSLRKALTGDQIKEERKFAEPDKKGRFYSTGKRKTAVARVWVRPGGGGKIEIQGSPMQPHLYKRVGKAFGLIGKEGEYSAWGTVKGGGVTAQAEAFSRGIARALATIGEEYRSILKKAGMLSIDSRQKERQKPGRKGARARYQFSKR